MKKPFKRFKCGYCKRELGSTSYWNVKGKSKTYCSYCPRVALEIPLIKLTCFNCGKSIHYKNLNKLCSPCRITLYGSGFRSKTALRHRKKRLI